MHAMTDCVCAWLYCTGCTVSCTPVFKVTFTCVDPGDCGDLVLLVVGTLFCWSWGPCFAGRGDLVLLVVRTLFCWSYDLVVVGPCFVGRMTLFCWLHDLVLLVV